MHFGVEVCAVAKLWANRDSSAGRITDTGNLNRGSSPTPLLAVFDGLTARGNTFYFCHRLRALIYSESTESNLLPEAPRLNNITACDINKSPALGAWDGTAKFCKYPQSTFNLLN